MIESRRQEVVIGDSPPHAVIAYFEAVDAGRINDAVVQLAPDVLLALPPPGGHEVDPRQIARGREEARALLGERGPTGARHEVVLCAAEGPSCYIEGVTRDRGSEPLLTFVANFQIDPAGMIRRYLAFACEPAVRLSPRTDSDSTMGDAARAVEGYFRAMDNGRFDDAAAFFSEDVLYCHPPYRHTNITSNRRVDFIGRRQLLEVFNSRGRTSFSHRVIETVQRGPNAMFECMVEGLPGGGIGSAVCSLSLDNDGRIRRYVAFYCEPGVERQ
jgi:ketosteroid isomerase-like protein